MYTYIYIYVCNSVYRYVYIYIYICNYVFYPWVICEHTTYLLRHVKIFMARLVKVVHGYQPGELPMSRVEPRFQMPRRMIRLGWRWELMACRYPKRERSGRTELGKFTRVYGECSYGMGFCKPKSITRGLTVEYIYIIYIYIYMQIHRYMHISYAFHQINKDPAKEGFGSFTFPKQLSISRSKSMKWLPGHSIDP